MGNVYNILLNVWQCSFFGDYQPFVQKGEDSLLILDHFMVVCLKKK